MTELTAAATAESGSVQASELGGTPTENVNRLFNHHGTRTEGGIDQPDASLGNSQKILGSSQLIKELRRTGCVTRLDAVPLRTSLGQGNGKNLVPRLPTAHCRTFESLNARRAVSHRVVRIYRAISGCIRLLSIDGGGVISSLADTVPQIP